MRGININDDLCVIIMGAGAAIVLGSSVPNSKLHNTRVNLCQRKVNERTNERA